MDKIGFFLSGCMAGIILSLIIIIIGLSNWRDEARLAKFCAANSISWEKCIVPGEEKIKQP